MGGKLSTGIKALDRRLDGGLRSGDMLAIVSPPATQSQTLLYQLMNERPTLYVSTIRPQASIERDLELRGGVDFSYQIAALGSGDVMNGKAMRELTGSRTYTAETALKDDPLDDVYDLIRAVDGVCNVIVDPVNPLERGDSRDAYTDVLTKLSLKMQDRGGVGVLHCNSLDDAPPFRDSTLMIADVVWKLELVSTTKNNIEFKLQVPKNRGGALLSDELSLEIDSKTVGVDDSRMI